MRIPICLTLALVLAACAGAASPAAPPTAEAPTASAPAAPAATPEPDALRVLFIGNSLTAYHTMPAMVQDIAAAAGERPLVYRAVTAPDYSLEDHWRAGEARQALEAEPWDVVVLQQGPSAAEESRVLLVEYTRAFAAASREHGARPALYMVWPHIERRYDFASSGESYAMAAVEVDGILLPAGDAWRAAWQRDPCLKLYAPDGLHPSPLGAYLAALTIFARLYERPVTGLPAPSIKNLTLEDGQLAILQAAASEAAALDLTLEERRAQPTGIPLCPP